MWKFLSFSFCMTTRDFSSRKLEILPPSGSPPRLNWISKYLPWSRERHVRPPGSLRCRWGRSRGWALGAWPLEPSCPCDLNSALHSPLLTWHQPLFQLLLLGWLKSTSGHPALCRAHRSTSLYWPVSQVFYRNTEPSMFLGDIASFSDPGCLSRVVPEPRARAPRPLLWPLPTSGFYSGQRLEGREAPLLLLSVAFHAMMLHVTS